ncbi:MAG: DUF6491 family protein [Rudaea sp.]|nr:DUF6491 family protein [Rudaea sp.]
MRKILSVAACLSAIAATAFADTPATEAANLARFEKYAGAPVENFTMWSMYKWQGLGPDKIAVWTKVNEAYLLTVAQPCIRLEDAKGIVVTSQMSHQVNRRLDYVDFAHQHCQIVEIRPLDYKTMLKDGDSGSASK